MQKAALLVVTVAALTLAASAPAVGINPAGNTPDSDALSAEQRRAIIDQIFGVEYAEGTPDKVIYGTDDRKDWYQAAAPQLTWAKSTCVVTDKTSVTLNGNGTYTLATTAWTTQGGTSVCSTEKFRGQPLGGWCSAFLVAPDIVATAGHCITSTSSAQSSAFVFEFAVPTSSGTATTTFPASDVYFGTTLIARQQLASGADYAIVRLDRAVTASGATPLPIRRTGTVANNTLIGVIGHPNGLPSKIAFGSNTRVRSNAGTGFFTANLDTYGGNSGSAVFDATTGVVEGILVRGDNDFVNSGGCIVSQVNTDTGGRGEDVTKATEWQSFVPTGTGTPTPTPTATATSTATATPSPTPTSNVLTSGVPASGNVATGAWTQYTINVPAGSSQMVVAMTGSSGDADMYIRKAGVPTSSLYDYRPYLSGSNETVTITGTSTPTALGSGTWYIGVYGYTGPAPYTLTATITAATATATPSPTPTVTPTAAGDTYEADNTAATAKTITVNGATQTHNISPATDQDWVKFTTTATQNIHVETNGPSGGDTYVYVYNSNGTTLRTSDDDSGTGLYSLTSSASLPAGTYYVKVISYNSASSITGYTLRVYSY